MGQGKAELLERAKEFLKVAEMALDADCHHAAALCTYAARNLWKLWRRR